MNINNNFGPNQENRSYFVGNKKNENGDTKHFNNFDYMSAFGSNYFTNSPNNFDNVTVGRGFPLPPLKPKKTSGNTKNSSQRLHSGSKLAQTRRALSATLRGVRSGGSSVDETDLQLQIVGDGLLNDR